MAKARRYWYLGGAMVALLAAGGATQAKPSKRSLPERFQVSPYTIMSLSVGSPNRGWQVRAKKLRPTDYLIVKDNSKHASFGHPALVLMLRRTAKQMVNNVESQPLVVGDLSREHGGPLYGHRSHQSGRDADVGFFALDKKGNPTLVERFIKYGPDGLAKDGSGIRFDEYRNWLMVLTWMKDERADIKHVFVASHLRQRLLNFARSREAFKQYADDAAKFLLQPKNASAHEDHFHVRIACPKRHDGLCYR